MNFIEFVPLVAIVFGTTLVGYVFTKIVGLIKYGIDRKHNSSDDIELLLHQFNNYKKSVEKRLQNLEAIVAEDPITERDTPLLDSERKEEMDKDSGDITDNRRLHNMLKKTH
jgi:hypothetical protein